MIAVPPFRGSDEFDHAYRAAGVVSGQWLLEEKAADGRRILVEVPASLVEAAGPQCRELSYTDALNCDGIPAEDAGKRLVATGAGPYNPLFYWVVGAAAHPFTGSAALYAMRAAAVLMCGLCLSAAVAIVVSQSPRLWELVGLTISLTPVFVYSTAVAAPNGLEMCAGLLLWTSLLGLVGGRRPDLERRYLAAAAVAVVLMSVLRMLGPLWVVCTVVTVLVYAGRSDLARLVRAHGTRLLAVGALGLLAVTGAAAWTVVADGTTSTGTGSTLESPVSDLAGQSVIWVAQLVAAFPYRDQFAPTAAYPLYLLVVLAGLVLAVLRGSRRDRMAVVLAVVLTVAAPVLLTLATVASQGLVWQGRYALPFVVGVMVLAGRVLDDSAWAPDEGPRLAAVALVMTGLAWVLGLHRVVVDELAVPASVRSLWPSPSPYLVDLLCALAFAAFAWATIDLSLRRGSPDVARVETEDASVVRVD